MTDSEMCDVSNPEGAGDLQPPLKTDALKASSWRLLDTGPGAPAWNMALDEALLEAFEDGAPPILRLYRWSPAALSLGRFQPHTDVEVPQGAVLVRRSSGGAAIHHREDEVTYSVIAPYRLFGGLSPRCAYHAIHDVLRVALRALGVSECDAPRQATSGPGPLRGMCFDKATDYDLVAAGRKLVGSAQRRRGRFFLQHGSLPLSPDPLSRRATSLAELLGAAPAPRVVSDAIAAAFAATVGGLTAGSTSESERGRAERLARDRYGDPAWTSAR